VELDVVVARLDRKEVAVAPVVPRDENCLTLRSTATAAAGKQVLAFGAKAAAALVLR
jgi:hypothetical protein